MGPDFQRCKPPTASIYFKQKKTPRNRIGPGGYYLSFPKHTAVEQFYIIGVLTGLS